MLTVGLKLEMVHAETRRERMVLGKPKEWIASGACGGDTGSTS